MELQAPPRWQCVDFISDLHLHRSDLLTFKAWEHYLRHTSAEAVFILGDLFDVWVGDDAMQDPLGFEHHCVQVLRSCSNRLNLYLMQGNRDFFMGQKLMQAVHGHLLDDPSVLVFGDTHWLLTHGDALCLGDTDYMAFRATVRSTAWQEEFLAKPLAQRQHIARTLRAQSELHKQSQTGYADVDAAAAIVLLQQHQATCMVHGHTHRPGNTPLTNGCERVVLSDWDLTAQPPRSEVLRLQLKNHSGTVNVTRLSPLNAGPKPVD